MISRPGKSKMKSERKLRNVAVVLLLTISGMLSSGCALRIKVATDCTWYEPVALSQATEDWLAELEWPEPFFEEIKRMGDNEENFNDFCE